MTKYRTMLDGVEIAVGIGKAITRALALVDLLTS
jgi:hypothetical protein